jgi:hypothetical protein
MMHRSLVVLVMVPLLAGCGEPTAPGPVIRQYARVGVDHLISGEGPDSIFLWLGRLQFNRDSTYWFAYWLNGTGRYPQSWTESDRGTYHYTGARVSWPVEPTDVELYLMFVPDTGRAYTGTLYPRAFRGDTLVVFGGPFEDVALYVRVGGW